MDFIDSLAWWQLILLAAALYAAGVVVIGWLVARANGDAGV